MIPDASLLPTAFAWAAVLVAFVLGLTWAGWIG